MLVKEAVEILLQINNEFNLVLKDDNGYLLIDEIDIIETSCGPTVVLKSNKKDYI